MKANQPILLVEDNDDDVLFFERAAKKTKLENFVFRARDGQEAIDYLAGAGRFADRAAFPLPCLVLLDLNLPLKNGLQVLEWIRGANLAVHFVVITLTSSNSEADMRDAYRLGANSYLLKPGDPTELEALLGLIKNYWMERNQFPSRCG